VSAAAGASSAVEFHRPVAVERIGASGLDATVEATEAEGQMLARRMAIPAVSSLSCRYRLTALPGGTVLAEGHLCAAVVQTCVVTLEPFEAAVEERFRVRFVPAGAESDDEDPDADDEIPYQGAVIDLGEAAAEQLALALDPYPRKPDATLPQAAGDAAVSPFAALARLKRTS
jgi:uncharacterized metal-binding protein YceD (DUF177 family)